MGRNDVSKTAELDPGVLYGGHRERTRLVLGPNFLIAVNDQLRAGAGVKHGVRLLGVDSCESHLDALETVGALLTRPIAAQVKNDVPRGVGYRAFLHSPRAHVDLRRSSPADELRPAAEVDLDIIDVDA